MRTSIIVVLVLFTASKLQSQWLRLNGPNGGYVNALAAIGSTVFASTEGRIFSSSNDGTTWSRSNTGVPWISISTGLENPNTLSLAVFGNNLYAGSSGAGI